MQNELEFLIRLCLFAALHSLFSTQFVKRVFTCKRQFFRLSYRLTYNFLSLALFAWVMASGHNTRVLYVVPGKWSLVMHLIQLVFLLLCVNCVRHTGVAEFLGLPQKSGTEKQPHGLVINGCYGVVRHPLYLFSILFMLFNPVISVRWLIFTVFSTIYFIIGALIEERRLSDEFGDQYRIYSQQVPFIIPGWLKTTCLPRTKAE